MNLILIIWLNPLNGWKVKNNQYGQFNINYPSTVIRDDFVLDYSCSYNYVESINNIIDYVIRMKLFMIFIMGIVNFNK